MPTTDAAPTAEDWLTTPPGRYLLAREQTWFDGAVADIFGYNALQLGLPQASFLRASRIACRMQVGVSLPAGLRAHFHDLPIASNSIDLVVLPHVLEFSDNPHQVLREVARVLVPEGQALIACFNPWSLWGARRAFGRKTGYPWSGRFIHLQRLKDWLTLLELEIMGGRMDCYVPPCTTDRWLRRFDFMDAAGDRWWPVAGGVYCLQAVKRVRGMRLIMPKWSNRMAPKERLAPVPKKVRQSGETLAARETVGMQ